MPLDKLVLIIFAVLVAVGATVWIGAVLISSFAAPFGWLSLIPAALAGYIVWRVIAERIANHDDDHYDRIEK